MNIEKRSIASMTQLLHVQLVLLRMRLSRTARAHCTPDAGYFPDPSTSEGLPKVRGHTVDKLNKPQAYIPRHVDAFGEEVMPNDALLGGRAIGDGHFRSQPLRSILLAVPLIALGYWVTGDSYVVQKNGSLYRVIVCQAK